MSDDEAIRRTLALYGQLCDDGRFGEWAQLFTEDATFGFRDTRHVGRPALEAFISASLPPERRGKHLLGQSAIDVDGAAGTASAVTDFTFIAKTAEGGFAITQAGRYHDTFVRGDDGAWRFATHEIRFLGE